MAIISNEELAKCFRDTKHFCEEDFTLSEASADTNRRVKVYPADFSEEADVKKAGDIRVFEGRTLREALKLHKEFPGKKIAVLNFAASGTPGGGVLGGAHAQEESICRSSTLYSSLLTQKAYEGFYEYHHKNCGWEASDTCIYSPDVIICKDDSDGVPERLTPEEFVKVDVITCAAPHVFSNVQVSDDELFTMHVRRAGNIMRAAACNGADILITGAFGCGAFRNPAKIVAGAWHEALKDYRMKFDLTAFVIYVSDYPPKHEGGVRNLEAFRNEFCGE
ncbi:MAG: TIGR02452 family protein [Synergistaceae bacterium]|nr:TIGR02452 family protein [Synergistaceae bacterium]